MAEYTSRHTGLQIDEALDSALNVKQVRGIVKMTDAGPVAAVPDKDFIADSGSIVSVTGLLKGVRNAETNEIEVQQATAGTDYQTPLTAGADYATPSVVVNKQNKITAQGLLKGLGDGSVTEATPGEDYQLPIPAGTYATPDDAKVFLVTFTGIGSGITADKTIDEIYTQYTLNRNIIGLYRGCLFPLVLCQPKTAVFQGVFNSKLGMIQYSPISGTGFKEAELVLNPSQRDTLPDSGTALTANTIYAVADAVGTYAFTPPESGWAHGTFTTGTSVSVSFAGTFLGTAPSTEASKTYEFDVLNGVWAVQEVVSA